MDSSLAGLIKWIEDNGGYISPHLERRVDSNGVSGIYTKVSIPAKEILIKIPNKLCITDKTYISPPDWSVKAKHMYSLLKDLKSTTSFYTPLLVTIPDLKEYRESHPFIALSTSEKKKVESYCVIYRMFRESHEGTYNDICNKIQAFDPIFTADELLRAYMLIVTRTWPGLYVPYMDLFNHSVQYGAVNRSTPITQELYTSVDYPANSQIYISYGIKDVLSLAYDYGFYDDTDFSISIPRRLSFIADTPLRFAVAKHILNFGLNGEVDVNNNLNCYYKDMSIFCSYDNFIGFSDHGISQQTWDLFSMMAIDNFTELEKKKGTDEYTKQLLVEHIQSMLTSVDSTIDVSDSESGSYSYRTLIRASKKRLAILNNCLEWLRG